MPPEPLPLDRKDLFKERKHERPESLGSVSRWRDSSSHHAQREFNRWGSADLRRHQGHGKQGGWHLFSEDYGNGYAVPRSGDKMVDDGCTTSISRGDGKYVRISRVPRGSFSQKDGRGYSGQTSSVSPNASARPHEVNNDQRSVADTLTHPSVAHAGVVNPWEQLPSNDQHGIGGVNGSGTGQNYDKEKQLGPLEWKTLKWARSGSLSSWGSGFSHSSSSKSVGAIESNKVKLESRPKNGTPVQSPSGDAATCVTSPAPSEDSGCRKKPRLKWGEGLAKYEKKKVDVPIEGLNRNVAVFSSSYSEPAYAHGSNLSDRSPRMIGLSGCSSPATPSSFACSSSSGLEEKSFVKAANIDDVSNLCVSPDPGAQSHLERFPFNLEKLDISLIAGLGPITELLQLDNSNPADSSFTRSTAMSKLLVWKCDISKALEITETEIDMLENELTSLKSESGESSACPAGSSSLPVESNAKTCQEQGVLIPRPAPLHVISCGDTMEEMAHCNGALGEVHADVKDDDIDSPGTATSKFAEPLGECAGDLNKAQSASPGPGSCKEEAGTSTCRYGNLCMIKDEPFSSDPRLHAEKESVLFKLILDSNKESADQASEVFNKLLPSNQYKLGVPEVIDALVCHNAPLIREKLAMRKLFVRFKERAITLKFKALCHLWKEDLHVLSMDKYRAKSQRKIESSLRIAHNGCHKHRSSIRPRLLSPARNLSMVPTPEIISFIGKMCLDSQVKLYRNALKMPALILDKREKMSSRFVTGNGLVEDPCAVEKERAMINPWTSEEIELFLDKLAIFGKDFSKIASFLSHKTTADCVEFYYKNHKSDYFKKTKKLDATKQGKSSTSTYLVTSEKRWNREMNVASLDMLGTVSVMAARADSNMVNMHKGRFHLGGYSDSKVSQGHDGILERTCSFDKCNDRETAAADVLAGICGSISSEAMGSCITSSVDPGEGYRDWKYQKVDSTIRQPSPPDVTQDVDGETCSDESCGEMDPVDWTDEEKSIFIQAVSSYGKDFLKISQCVRTRSRDQCKVFFSKARKCLGLDLIHPSHGNVGTAVSNGMNRGDDEDACLVESGSVVRSDKSGSKMDEDMPSLVNITNHYELSPAETLNKIQQNCPDAAATSTAEECEMEDRPGSASDSNKCAIEIPQLGLASISSGTLTNAEGGQEQVTQQVAVTQSVTKGPSSCNPVHDETKGVSEVSIGGLRNGLDGNGHLFSGCSLDGSRDENCNAGTSDQESSLQCSARDSNAAPNASYIAAEASSCSGLSLNSECGHGSYLTLDKPPVISLQQERSLDIVNLYTQGSAVVQCEKIHNHDGLSSTHDSESREKQCWKSVSRDGCYHKNLSGHPILNHVEPSPILRGYPLQMHKKEKNGDLSCGQAQGLPKYERNFSGRYLGQDCFLKKCNSSVVAPQTSEQANNCPKSHSRSLSDSEKPSRNGDVKLFGKILTTPPLQQSNSSTQENDPKLSSSVSSGLKVNGHHENSGVLKFDQNNYVGLENIPMSYGFWDGSIIQTGFSSLPDSAMLLAKYPAAFANYPTTKMEKQPAVVECSLNRVSVFPTRGISSSNGVVDYQVCRSLDSVEPFTVDMKQQHPDVVLPRRNGFERIPNVQQQQGRVSAAVGGVGIIPIHCAGISDPVAAIKMHYAKTDHQYGGSSIIAREEDEAWRGGVKGDIGGSSSSSSR